VRARNVRPNENRTRFNVYVYDDTRYTKSTLIGLAAVRVHQRKLRGSANRNMSAVHVTLGVNWCALSVIYRYCRNRPINCSRILAFSDWRVRYRRVTGSFHLGNVVVPPVVRRTKTGRGRTERLEHYGHGRVIIPSVRY